MNKVLIVAGPTASGKSAFAVKAAKMLETEIISVDAVQVYKGLDIGSGKLSPAAREGVKHQLIDILSPFEPCSVAFFQKRARALIEQSDKPMILAGGTGLYLKAVVEDYTFPPPSVKQAEEADFSRLDNDGLYGLLKEKDPLQAEKIHPHNRRRVLRALMIASSGRKMSEINASQTHRPIYDILTLGLTMPRQQLYQRINTRVDEMFAEGLKNEVENLLDKGVTFAAPGMKAIGYREWQGFFMGEMTEEEVREEIKKDSRHYAKKQYTWLNHQMDVFWFNPLIEEEESGALEKIRKWAIKQSPGCDILEES